MLKVLDLKRYFSHGIKMWVFGRNAKYTEYRKQLIYSGHQQSHEISIETF